MGGEDGMGWDGVGGVTNVRRDGTTRDEMRYVWLTLLP